jgi:hypothetical protein
VTKKARAGGDEVPLRSEVSCFSAIRKWRGVEEKPASSMVSLFWELTSRLSAGCRKRSTPLRPTNDDAGAADGRVINKALAHQLTFCATGNQIVPFESKSFKIGDEVRFAG